MCGYFFLWWYKAKSTTLVGSRNKCVHSIRAQTLTQPLNHTPYHSILFIFYLLALTLCSPWVTIPYFRFFLVLSQEIRKNDRMKKGDDPYLSHRNNQSINSFFSFSSCLFFLATHTSFLYLICFFVASCQSFAQTSTDQAVLAFGFLSFVFFNWSQLIRIPVVHFKRKNEEKEKT